MTIADTRNDRSFTLVRRLSAPREEVFRAWTDPEHLGWYFSGNQAPDERAEVDLRVGGQWRLLMVENAERSYTTGGVYREIVPGERLSYWWGSTDGWPRLDLAHPEGCPLVTVELVEVGGGTEMTLRLDLPAAFSDDEAREWFGFGIVAGMGATIQRLVDLHPADRAR